jgi:peptidyl-prolyl cis-trans isomerase D
VVKPFEAVADAVKQAVLAEARAAKAAEDAKALEAKITPDKPLAAVAAADRLTVTTTAPFTKTGARDLALPPSAIAKLFDSAPGGVVVAAAPNGQYVAQLKEITAADPAADTAGADKVKQQASQAIAGDLATAYEQALRQRYPVDIHHAVLDRLF